MKPSHYSNNNFRCDQCGVDLIADNEQTKCVWCALIQQLNDVKMEGQTKCINSGAGCTYISSNERMVTRHQQFFCKYSDYSCWECNEKYTGTRYIDHKVQLHCKQISTAINNEKAISHFTCRLLATGQSLFVAYVRALMMYVEIYHTVDEIFLGVVADTQLVGCDHFDIDFHVKSTDGYDQVVRLISGENFDWDGAIDISSLHLPPNSLFTVEMFVEIKR